MSYVKVTSGSNIHLINEAVADTRTVGGDGAGNNKHYLGEIDATDLPAALKAVGHIYAVSTEIVETITGTVTLNGTAVSAAAATAGTILRTDLSSTPIVDGATLAFTAVTAGKFKITVYTND